MKLFLTDFYQPLICHEASTAAQSLFRFGRRRAGAHSTGKIVENIVLLVNY